ncbi:MULTISPECIES: HpcH/HpaI aldolase/citrate lyase family protein [Prauserella salsuginis group]|uniref:Citrate lyase subunit beta/citryl-CoA lyase n=2 Tax=Prauserella salsuginis group TaxID=2893672 RepID=A0A839XYQ2_9PSEU|nr:MULTISPECIES: CoA ester lyase [Prauserella salsuginis group]MBB3665146.1 citrate lyase subunit beta/citryl-CoA lyase [Prauserella sediminis]MCR3718614.1 citrate lyase subunit beta / citryl-CoA lyase [Prauserella flava]MCR3733184.1 citrate lyase subunit beta / citryl-CoA lyase [Prauserella salsuginis]
MGEDGRERTAIAEAVSWLFVPASRPERFERAIGAGADVVVIDLEDAVGADEKDTARDNLVRHWPGGDHVVVVVRVNALHTEHGEADLAACRRLGPDAVVLPKTESADDVAAAATAAAAPVLPLVETARGLVELGGIAAADDVVRLLFGSVDLALDLGVSADAALDTARSDLVRWSAARGLPQPVDGVSTAIRDTDAVTRSAERALAWGFGGKLCIHPTQVPLVHAAFAPTAEELAWAERVLAVESDGAAVVDGEMIDRPVVERARRIAWRRRRDGD